MLNTSSVSWNAATCICLFLILLHVESPARNVTSWCESVCLLSFSQEAERKALENERRRRKLEEMREVMAEDGSPIKPPPKPPRISDLSEETPENLSGRHFASHTKGKCAFVELVQRLKNMPSFHSEESLVVQSESGLSFQEPDRQSEVLNSSRRITDQR